MTEPTDKTRASRRRFLAGAAKLSAASLAAAGASVRAALADNAKNLPPNVPDWTRNLGDGVGVRAYGNPSKYEKACGAAHGVLAHRYAGILGQLHAAACSSTASSRRTGCASSATIPASPRSIRNDYRLMLHGLVDKPLIFTLDDFKRLPRVNRIHFLECAANSGMEWRGAQLNGANTRTAWCIACNTPACR